MFGEKGKLIVTFVIDLFVVSDMCKSGGGGRVFTMTFSLPTSSDVLSPLCSHYCRVLALVMHLHIVDHTQESC